MSIYHYTECGLDNVYIEGTFIIIDDDGDEVVTIPNINSLHNAIAHGLINKPVGLTGRELRFLRTHMGMTQAELARLVHREPLSVSRWERDEGEIDSNADTLIRLHANDVLGLQLEASTHEVSLRAVPSAEPREIRIDGTDPDHYRPVAA